MLKYVMINGCLPILFHKSIEHKKFKDIGKITSAGFVNVYKDETVMVYGKSVSLDIESKEEEDEKWIERLLYGE